MPKLRHSNDGEFSYSKSEVAKWILEQEESAAFLFLTASQAGVIKFEKGTSEWAGETVKIETDAPLAGSEVMAVFAAGEWLSSSEIAARCWVKYQKRLGMWKWNVAMRTMVERGQLVRDAKSKLYHPPIVRDSAG